MINQILPYLIIAGSLLLLGIIAFLIFKRNYFNKYKYVRLERFNSDRSITVRYIKRKDFNKDNNLKINPNHIFNFKGYTSVITHSNSAESIDPLDFKSQYDAKEFRTAINSKLIQDTFATLKKPKIDLLMVSVVLNVIVIMILLYSFFMGGKV